MNCEKRGLILLIIISIACLAGCEFIRQPIKETPTAYQVQKGTTMIVILKPPLGSNENQRGDQFVGSLKHPISFKGKFIISKGSEIKGLVKRVIKYEKFGDRVNVFTKEPNKVASKIMKKCNVEKVTVRQATLEDVFLKLAGRALRD